MDLFVVSRSRWKRSDTLERLGNTARRVRLVVPEWQQKEYGMLSNKYGCELLPCPHDGISLTRRFCGENSREWCFAMMDDDLKFYRRVSPSDWHLRYPTDLNDTIETMLRHVRKCLAKYVHVSVGAREGNNRLPYEGVECSRPLRFLAYRTDKFLELEHGRVKIMEDFDVTLQLLRKGYANHVTACWAQGQIQTQMSGGCSDYRTLGMHEEEVKKFASLHPEFVRLRNKENKSGGEFGKRLEVTIYWRKALDSSQIDKEQG